MTIVAVGSLLPVKRWDRLLKAVYRLRQNGFDFLVKIAGEGRLRGDLETQAEHLGVGDRVDFIGQRGDIPALMAEASILVHTSDSEGCPNVVMEAMACGRPVVATDVGDTASLVEDGKTGYVVGRADDESLVERIERLLKDPALRRQMGEAGRAKAERDFGLNRLVEETLAAYRIAGWQSAAADISESSPAAA
jgi:glycosyltransferase involved in cell wall biosynthesis